MANRQEKIFYAIDKRIAYDKNGTEYSNNQLPYIYTKEQVDYTVQYCTGFTDKDNFTPYTDFTGSSISSSAVIDNDYDHVDEGTLATGLTGAITEIEINGLTNPPLQEGFIQLVNAADESETVEYTAVTTGTTGTTGLLFTVNTTLNYTYQAGDESNVNDPALIKTTDIDETNKDTGLFIITMDANSRPYIREIKGQSALTKGKTRLEHQVRDSEGDLAFVADFEIECRNIMDDDGVIPPPDNGNYYTKSETDALLANKMDKQPTAASGNIAEFDALGQVIDSGFNFADFGVDVTNQSTALLNMTGTTTASGTVGNVILPAITGEVIDVELNTKYPVTNVGGEVTITAPQNVITLFSVDKDGVVYQTNPPVDCVEARDRIFFSAASTKDGVNVDAVADITSTTPYSPALSISDFWDAHGSIVNEKDIVYANGSNLSINVIEHNIWATAINFKDKKCPNKKTIASKNAPTFTRYWSDGVGGSNSDSSSVVDPTKWDDGGGVLKDVGENQFQNINVFITPQDEEIAVFYGQTLYSSRAGALAGVNEDIEKSLSVQIFRDVVYLGTITVRDDTTDLSDQIQASFIQGQKVEKVFDNIVSLGDGLIQNRHSVSFNTDGVTSSITIEATEEDEIEMQLDGQPYKLASPSSINLLHGTDINPKVNYVYITAVGSAVQLNVSETAPTVDGVGLFANVWQGVLASATYTGNYGPKTYQKKTDYFGGVDQSWVRTVNDHLRRSALVKSGVTPTSTPAVGAGTSTTLYIQTTEGYVDQLTPHFWPAYDSSVTDFEVPNDETTAFVRQSGLHQITTDVNGTSLLVNNRIANFFVFGTQDEDGSYAKVYVNKPNGYYSDQTAGIADAGKTAIYDYPAGFEGTNFPIARYTTKYTSGGNFEVLAIADLTDGTGEGGGGGTAGVTSFLGLTDTPSSFTGFANYQVFVNPTEDGLAFVLGGAGEANTASNAGTGVSLPYQKNGVDIEFNGIASLDNIVEIGLNAIDHDIEFNINQENINISASQVTNFASVLAGTTNTTPFTPTAPYHPCTKDYADSVAQASLWGTQTVITTNYAIVESTDLNKRITLGAAATAQRTITTDATASDKFNFWVDSENATYDVVVAGSTGSFDNTSATGGFNQLSSTNDDGFAECFTAPSDFQKVRLSLSKVGSPTGNITINVYAIAGTIEVDAIPTGTALSTATINSESLTTDFLFYDIDLDTLVSSGNVAVSVEYSGGNSSNAVKVQKQAATATMTGNTADLNSSTWAYLQNVEDMNFGLGVFETIAGQSTYTVSKDNKGVTQFIKDGADYKVNFHESADVAGGGVLTSHFQDRRSNGVNGDAASATTTQTRTLNYDKINDIPGVSRSGNQITIATAGTYYIEAYGSTSAVNENLMSIVNVGGEAFTTEYGDASHSTSSSTIYPEIRKFKLITTASTTFELRHFTQLASATGLGKAVTLDSGPEIYAGVIITKEG
jgi:hypothetical protein